MRLQVKATNGDTFLGGEDFDNVLLQVRMLGCIMLHVTCQAVQSKECLHQRQHSPQQLPPV
jgi:Hsp70 protein